MKRIICTFLCLLMLIMLFGCDSSNTGSTDFKQEITIITMTSPPKCKTTDNTSKINEILNVLGEIKKEPVDKENGDWIFMIKLTVDGKTFDYTVGSIFTDSDGTQYNITNYDEIKEKLTEIYDKISAEEAEYT